MILRFAVLLGVLLNVAGGNLNKIRDDFHHLDSNDKLNRFIKRYENSIFKKSEPYVATAIMQKAKYVFSPYSKLHYFSKGKKKLEGYIAQYPNCIEGRYMRLLTQSKVPAILGYKSHIQSDKRFVLKHIEQSSLPKAYKTLILKNIKNIK